MATGEAQTELAPVPAQSARALLVTWANQQDHWLRGIVGEVLETRRPLSDERVTAFYERFLVEKELATGAIVDVAPLVWDEGATEKAESLVLKTLESVDGVNALSTGQSLALNRTMTIVFGENGAGKTGYVRILKRVANVRTAEDILPNVRGAAGPTPSAVIRYAVGDKDMPPLSWDGAKGVHPLTRMDVFDARAVDLHIDEDLTYVYTPSDIALFRFVHDALEGVKAKVDAARQARAPKGNPFLVRFSRDTTVYTKVESLGVTTDIRELQQLASVSAEEEAALPALKERLEALRSQTPEARATLLRNDKDVLSRVAALLQVVGAFDAVEYESLRQALVNAAERHDRASKTAFEGVDVPGVLGDAWQAFVHAGEAYIQEVEAAEYPTREAPCAYCRQPLTEKAEALVRKLREYADGALKKEVEISRLALERLCLPVVEAKVLDLRSAVEKRGTESALTASLMSLLTAIEGARNKIANRETVDAEAAAVRAQLSSARESIASEEAEINRLLGDIKAQAEARAKAFSEEQAKQKLLEARLLLRELLGEIEAHVASAKWAEKAQPFIKSRIPQLQKSLTEVSKTASERLLNQDFELRFRKECDELRAPSVKLDFPGKKGQPARRKVLAAGHRLSAILSEGEQKALALADFLAEASLKGSSTPIVFDDPVTSLDYKRHLYVADRLVQISRERQVIVFTHNIWFTTELLSRFEKNADQCSYYSVGGSDGIGVLSKGSHPRADTFKTMKGKLNALLQDAKKLQGETLEAVIERGYEILRGICEVVVEVDLFQGVVQRYQPNIGMTKLAHLKPQALGPAAHVIGEIFEKACRYIASHSQPLETLNVRPTLQELQKDWDDVQKARDEYLAAKA